MKNLILSLLSITFLLASCSKEEQAPPPPPTPTYTLSFSAEDGGSVSSEGGTYTQGSKITVTATPDAQYLFKEWSDGSTTNPREITVTSNLTLKASFIKKTYPLAVTIEGEGTVQEEVIIQGSTSETEYNAGTTVRLTATPNEGWVFAGWSGDVESEELEIEVPIEKGTSVSALFKRDSFELNITIEGEGTVKEEVIVQPGQYDYETVVRLTAIPSEGQKFTGWSGDVISEENPIEVELNSEINITVAFESIAFLTLSERFSAINETTGYFKGQEYFSEYLSKDFLWNTLSAPFEGDVHWHTWHKNAAILDFDGDGKQDIVSFATSFCTDHIYSYHKGKFLVLLDYKNNSTPQIFESDHYFGSGKMEVNDFDSDGVSEVLFFATETKMNMYNAEEDTGGDLNIPPLPPALLKYVNGTLVIEYVGITGDNAGGTSGDIDNDGDIDFIQWSVPSIYNGESVTFQPTLLLNNGNLSFTSTPLIPDLDVDDWYTTTFELFDINGDGNLDLLAGWRVGDTLWYDSFPNYFNSLSGPIIMFGDGTGSFYKNNSFELPEAFLSSRGLSASLLGFGFTDFDKDGDIDIILSTTRDEPGGNSENGKYYKNFYLILFENREGAFVDATESYVVGSFNNDFTYTNFYLIKTIDTNDDGYYDIVPDAFANWDSIEYGTSLKWLNISGTFIKN